MTLPQQLIWGSLFLGGSLLLETAILLWCVKTLRRHERKLLRHGHNFGHLLVLLIAIGFTVLGHTCQIWIWAAALMGHRDFCRLEHGDLLLARDLYDAGLWRHYT